MAEVISFEENHKVCPFHTIESYPIQVGSATGGILKDKIVICGGFDSVTKVHRSDCFALDENLEWLPYGQLQYAREGSASIVTENGNLIVV